MKEFLKKLLHLIWIPDTEEVREEETLSTRNHDYISSKDMKSKDFVTLLKKLQNPARTIEDVLGTNVVTVNCKIGNMTKTSGLYGIGLRILPDEDFRYRFII